MKAVSSNPSPDPHVIVVGAGLAGLTCAQELSAAGVAVSVLEATDGVGGRVRTDELDGFRLDRGFQVLLTAYPEAQRFLELDALDLRPFFPGAMIRTGGRFVQLADVWRRPVAGLAGLLKGVVSPADALRMARLRSRVQRGSPEERRAQPERSSAQRLRDDGFSEHLIQRFFRPFFGGVFLDPDLATSDRQLEFVFRMFAAGDIAVPARGMGEIPRRLAERLPDGSIRLGARVEAVEAPGVHLDGGEVVPGDAVVLACDGSAAAGLVAGLEEPSWRGTTCLYFEADVPPLEGPLLVLDGDGTGPVNNLCVMSQVSPEVAPPGRTLVSATVLDTAQRPDDALESRVRAQLRDWFGVTADGWRHLRTYRIQHALPDQSPPTPGVPVLPTRLDDGLYVCGDHRADSSINGAMASGRAAAAALLEDLRRPGG